METIEIIAQGIGFAGLAMNCLSYQAKSKRNLIVIQLFGALFFVIHFGMLGAIMGCMLNSVAVFRSLLFANAEKTNANHPAWLALFIAIYAGSYVLTFTVFETPVTIPNLLLQILPPVAMTFSTLSFRTKNAATVRKLCLFCSPLWLIYNIFNFSISGILTETISIISIVAGIIRLDLKRKDKA
jgi:hypothetical protein